MAKLIPDASLGRLRTHLTCAVSNTLGCVIRAVAGVRGSTIRVPGKPGHLLRLVLLFKINFAP